MGVAFFGAIVQIKQAMGVAFFGAIVQIKQAMDVALFGAIVQIKQAMGMASRNAMIQKNVTIQLVRKCDFSRAYCVRARLKPHFRYLLNNRSHANIYIKDTRCVIFHTAKSIKTKAFTHLSRAARQVLGLSPL